MIDSDIKVTETAEERIEKDATVRLKHAEARVNAVAVHRTCYPSPIALHVNLPGAGMCVWPTIEEAKALAVHLLDVVAEAEGS